MKTMNIGWATDIGNIRAINEDTVVAEVIPPYIANREGLKAVLMVADGMGGHQAGEAASGLAGKMTRQAFLVESPGSADSVILDTQSPPESRLTQRALEVVCQINKAVFAWEGCGTVHPGTTLTLCLCRAKEYVIAHVGDSRAYLLTRSGVCQLTDDDSWVGEAVRRGAMTPNEARNSHLRNQLTKSIGISEEVQPSVYEGTWASGDVLLLCSDGLTEYVMPEELRDGIVAGSSLQTACEQLVLLARQRGGHDNISLVAACEGLPLLASRKPPTWKGDEVIPLMHPRRIAINRSADTNRTLRYMLLTLLILAFLVMGIAAGLRRYSYKKPSVATLARKKVSTESKEIRARVPTAPTIHKETSRQRRVLKTPGRLLRSGEEDRSPAQKAAIDKGDVQNWHFKEEHA